MTAEAPPQSTESATARRAVALVRVAVFSGLGLLTVGIAHSLS